MLANSFKMAEGMLYQIWHACSQGKSRHDPENFFEKGAWLGSYDPVNFWALDANSSKNAKATDFKFAVRI